MIPPSISRFQNLNEAEEAQSKLNRSTQFGDKLMYVNFAEGDRKSKFCFTHKVNL